MAEKELMHDLHEKNEIRRDVEARQKVIDKSDIRDDREVYTAAMDKLKLYKEAYRINLVLPNGKEIAEEMLKKPYLMRNAQTKKIYTKYKKGDLSKEYPNNAKRAYIAISDFTKLELDFIVDRNKLGGAGERWAPVRRLGYSRAGNIGPNLDRIASRINTAEEGVRRKAQKEISQQNTENLATVSSIAMNLGKKKNIKEIIHPTEYMKRVGDKFIFTKESNPVKIQDVMSAFIKERPNDVFLLDYNGCIGNDNLKADIKKRTKNNSGKVYIKYNPNTKTYDFHNTDGTLLGGKRPYIWEGVTMMTKDVEGMVFEQKKQAQLDAATNVDYSKLANDLQKNFPEQIAALKNIQFTRSSSIYDELLRGNYKGENHPTLLRDFLVSTESRLDEVIKRRRANSRYNRDNPIDTGSGIFKARFVTGNAKTEVPLFVKESGKGAASIPEYLYEYMSGRTSQLKNYITQRFLSKWETLSHMERREQVVDLEGPAQTTDEKEKKRLETEIENKKELQLYGVEKLLQIVSNLEQKDENTPEELAEFAYHMEAIKNDILKAPKGKKISDASRQKAVKEAQTLFIKYKSNDGSRATMTDETARKLVSDILNGASRSKIQEAASELGVNMTLFDNTSRAGVVEDIINDGSEANQNYYDKPIQKFEKGIKSTNGITIDGITYKLECHPSGKKFSYTYTETGSNGNIIFQSEVTSETAELPKEGNGKIIRDKINAAREKYLNNEVKGNESPMKINNEEYDKCYQKICQLSYINVDEETGEIGPQANIEFIDKLMACDKTVSLGEDENGLDYILIKYGIITKEIADKDSYAYGKFKERILETIVHKRKMESEFKVTEEDMKRKYNAEIEELKRKTTRNDEEMGRMAILQGLVENEELLKEFADEQTKKGKKTIRYCGMDSLLHEHITPYLAKHGEGISGTNAEIYNDSNGLRGRWDWTDESCEKIGPILQDILIEVVITAVAIGLGAISGGAGTALVMGIRATALGARAASYANKINKFLKIAKFCEKLGKGINTAKKGRLITTLKNSRLGQSYARATVQGVRQESRTANFIGRRLATASETRGGRMITQASEWVKGTKLWKEGKSLGEIVKAGNIARKEGSLGMKAVGMIFEGTGFHVASTALHNAINGENLLNGLNPLDNFQGYAQSIAFLGVLKFLGKPINTMTSTSIEFALGEKISASQFGHAIKYIAGIGGEFGTLVATDEILNVAFEGELKEMTTEDAIHSIGMILGLRLHGKIKEIKKLTIKEYNKAKKELTVDFGEGEVKINENEVFNSEPKHKRTPEQEKLNNQYKRMERQSKYNKEFKQAKDLIKEIPENLRSESMKKFLEAGDMIELGFHEIKQIQREIGLKGKAVDGVLGPKSLKMLRDYISQKNRSNESVNNRVKDKATEILHKKFDDLIMSKNGITIDGITYKLERKPNEGHNPNRKGRVVYTETGPDGKVRVKIEANSDTFSLPENSNGNNIRERYNAARGKYVDKNLNATLESAKHELDGEFTRDIESRSRDLEGKRHARETLEGRKKSLSDEIEGLKSRKAQLEQQLKNIQKELTIQPNISSLRDIYSIIREGNKITIGGKKCTFIGIKGDKIIFSEGRGKTKEFSSFKELQDAGVNFNFDIKNRQGDRGLEQQIMFEELVGKEARTKNANEIIRNYEGLKRQKAQIEQDIRDGFFRENAEKLVGKHIWIDGVEYQCTGKNTNNGRTTLDFKKTDGNEHFTISSFEQLKNRGQVNGFGDRYDVIDKDTRAAGRELSEYERKNHDLLRGEGGIGQEPGIFKGEAKYVENKRQALQQVDQQLQRGKADYDNAKLATSPKKVPNPEYERIKNEIDGINSQLIEKGQQLSTIERDLGASDTDISKLEQEIAEITAERNNLSRTERGNDIIDNNGEIERGREEVKEEIERPEEMERKLDELITRTNNGEYENVKLDWVTKKMFEGSVYFEGLSRLFKKNRSFPKKFIKKIWDNFVEMKNKCRETLSEAKKKLVEKWNNFLERKLAEEGDVVEIKEEEINLIENESRINEGNRIAEEKPLTEKERLIESMGSDTHEGWRKKRLKNDGTYEPQIEETKDTEWIRRNGTNKVDLANTKFEDLPSDWKMENLKAAEVAIDLVYEKLSKGEEITPEMIEEMSKIVHDKRLERNGIEGSFENQRISYEQLPESEKAKDRDQVLEAIEKVGGRKKRLEIEKNFKERRQQEEQERRQREIEKENNQINSRDIDIFTRGGRFDNINDNLAGFASYDFNIHSKRSDVISKIGNDRLCIKLEGKTYFILKGQDHTGRPLNKTIRINKEIPDKTCQTILEDGKIFEVYDGKIGTGGIASHINEISQRLEKGSLKGQEREQREEQQRREREEAIEAIEITGYQENIETMDGGRFTGEIKDGQLYKGKFTDKNGNEWYIDKASEYPVLRYQDKILLDRIGNKESINVGELKRTHRTNFDVLKQIIDSGVIGNDGPRGVQFWGGLGACYGEVAVIMKNSVMNLPPAPSNVSKGHGNYDYFFSGQARNRDRSTFQKNASDFSFHRQAREENPNIDVPYLSIGGKNSNGAFANEVGIEHIEAVMLPAHAKNYPGYSELVKKINEKGIKVIEAPTEEDILDYAGGSIILAKDGRRGSFDEAIIQELSKKYPHISNFEQQVTTYLIETGRISESEIRGKSFAEIRENYIKMATENGFSRGGTRGGQYQNYSSQKNYTKEQQAYFKYIIETRATRESHNYPDPQIKAEIVDEAA